MKKEYAIGIDIGGQTTKAGIADMHGRLVGRSVIRTDSYGDDALLYLDALAAELKRLTLAAGTEGRIAGIGAGAPNGNFYTGCISLAPNIAWAAEGSVDFSGLLSERMGGLPVRLTNDANAAAAGEMRYGAARGMKDFIMITLGTGVGSGIVIDGRIVYGHDGFAGELGHVCAERENGRACGCGRKGCLECYCSATGVARTAREWLDADDEPSLLRNLPSVSSRDVYDAAVRGDALAKRIFEYTGTILGRSLADFIAFSAPEAIVLFGGLARAGELLVGPVRKAMEENVMRQWKGKVRLLPSALNDSDAAILGASALVWQEDAFCPPA